MKGKAAHRPKILRKVKGTAVRCVSDHASVGFIHRLLNRCRRAEERLADCASKT